MPVAYSIDKAGYVQREIKLALDVAEEQPEGAIYIIPVRLIDCQVPERLSDYHWVDMFDERGYQRLLKGLKLRASEIGLSVEQTPPPPAPLAKVTATEPVPPVEKPPAPQAKEAATPASNNQIDQWLKELEEAESKKDWDKVIQVGKQILKLDADHLIAFRKTADAFTNRGLSYYNLQQYQRAIQDYDRTIQLDPNDAMAFNNRGSSYYYLKQYQRAIQDYDQAIQLDPNFAMAYTGRGSCYHYLKQYQRAIQDYDRTIQLDPNFAMAYFNRGLAYFALGNKSAAKRDFQIAANLGYEDAAKELEKLA